MAKSSRGHIQQLPSSSFRVKVYAGTDPVTGKQRLLRQTCPDEASAHVALGRLLAEADGGRFPDRHATVGQALGNYLEVADLEVTTREAHEGYIPVAEMPVLVSTRPRASVRLGGARPTEDQPDRFVPLNDDPTHHAVHPEVNRRVRFRSGGS